MNATRQRNADNDLLFVQLLMFHSLSSPCAKKPYRRMRKNR